MKRIYLAFLLLSVISCEDRLSIKDCQEIIKGKPAGQQVKDSELSTIISLFRFNGLSYDNLLFTQLQTDELGHRHVDCIQYVNDLVLFTEHMNFHFDRMGKFYFRMGDVISGIEMNTEPELDMDEVRSVFFDNVKKDNFYGSSLEEIKKSCLHCELGYYDLNAGTSYAPHKFVLAWKIVPASNGYPMAYINDTDGSVIYYFNGIYTDRF